MRKRKAGNHLLGFFLPLKLPQKVYQTKPQCTWGISYKGVIFRTHLLDKENSPFISSLIQSRKILTLELTPGFFGLAQSQSS